MHSDIPIPEVPTKLRAEVQVEVARSQRKHDHHYYHHYHQHLKPFNARIRTLSHKTDFWPKSFCTRNVSHQRPLDHKPITPEALYTRSLLWCQKPLAPEGCTPKVFTSERLLLSGQNLLHHKHFTPNSFDTRRPLHFTPNAFCTEALYTRTLYTRSPAVQNTIGIRYTHGISTYNANTMQAWSAKYNKTSHIQLHSVMQDTIRMH